MLISSRFDRNVYSSDVPCLVWLPTKHLSISITKAEIEFFKMQPADQMHRFDFSFKVPSWTPQSDDSFTLKVSKSSQTLNTDPRINSSLLISEFHSASGRLIIFKMQPVDPVIVA